MENPTLMLTLVVLLAVVAVAMIALFAVRTSRRRRNAELRARFGPEYDRVIEQKQGNVPAAERELVSRQKRIEHRHLKAINEDERAQFAADWRNVQTRFVDDPSGAMQEADELIQRVMHARGYPNVRFEQRVADLSVQHAGVVQHYRAAHALAEANREGRANTEELRQAVVHYRALFDDLLEQQAHTKTEHTEHSKNLQEAHV